jgi:lycopene cyclase domain-containing protein
MSWLYLAAILGSTACMGLVDHRWRLFLFRRPSRALLVVAAGVVGFLTWDLLAIGLDIYRRGESPAMTGVELVPELPLEEVAFVVFLCYLTMVLHRLFARVLTGRAAKPGQPGREARELTR